MAITEKESSPGWRRQRSNQETDDSCPLTPRPESPVDWRDTFFVPSHPHRRSPLPRPRESPYVWVTWLARLLAGEASPASGPRGSERTTRTGPSRRVRFQFQAQWMLDHTALVNQGAGEPGKTRLHRVYTEGSECFPSPGEVRNPGREAGPDRG